MHLYKFIFYCLSGLLTSIHFYLQGEHITFDVGARDFKEAVIIVTSQEVWFITIEYGVFGIYDRWRRFEDRSFQDGGHHEVVGKGY